MAVQGGRLERRSRRSRKQANARAGVRHDVGVLLPHDDVGVARAVVLLHAGVADRRMWADSLPSVAAAGPSLHMSAPEGDARRVARNRCVDIQAKGTPYPASSGVGGMGR